jgi:hypothetical protein
MEIEDLAVLGLMLSVLGGVILAAWTGYWVVTNLGWPMLGAGMLVFGIAALLTAGITIISRE